MTMRTSDRLIAPSRGTLQQALTYAAKFRFPNADSDVSEYLTEVFRLAPLVGLDASMCVSQSVHETTEGGKPWNSHFWLTRLNPAGLGITGDPAQNNASHTFPNGAAAARGQISHLLVYALGPNDAGSLWFRTAKVSITQDDPRYDAYLDAYGNVARATTIKDLAGTWAADKHYAEGIVAKAAAIFPNLPNQEDTPTVPSTLNMTKGLIPLPDHVNDPIDVTQRDQSRNCRGYDYLGDRPDTPKFLVLHKSQCPPGASNSGYFHERCCPALTDWEVIATTGQMRRFVARGGTHEPSGWANGVVSNPYGDALKWLNLHGGDLNTVNRDGEAIEITGWFPSPPVTQDTPVSEAALQNIAQWIASRAHDYGITYETFPIIPNEDGRSYITWHQEWTIGTGKTCPGPWVMNHTEDLFDRARAIMMEAQTGSTATPPNPVSYDPPVIPDWLTDDLKGGLPTDHVEGDLTYYAALRPYTTKRKTNRLQVPDVKGEKVGPAMEAGEKFRGMYTVIRNKRSFVLTPWGSYIDANALTPKLTVKAA